MKKILAAGLALVLALCLLPACNGNTKIPNGGDPSSGISTATSGETSESGSTSGSTNSQATVDPSTSADPTTATDPTTTTDPATATDPAVLIAAANNQFADYIIKMAKDIAASGNLLESTVGDISAHKMTAAEVTEKAEAYRAIILGNINNEEVVSIREENGKRYYEFYIEKSLNILGVGTHMSIGFPDYLEVVTVDELGYRMTAVFSCNI